MPRNTAASRQTANQCGLPSAVPSARYSRLMSGSTRYQSVRASSRFLSSVSNRCNRRASRHDHWQAANPFVRPNGHRFEGDDINAGKDWEAGYKEGEYRESV
jgi:hypothetical protein